LDDCDAAGRFRLDRPGVVVAVWRSIMRVLCFVCAIVCGFVASVTPRLSAGGNRVLLSNAADVDSGIGIDGTSSGSVPDVRSLIVQGRFGGRIFGFDIDQDGIEGLLAEALTQDDGTVLAAVETFNQRTGEIISVVAQIETEADDFLALGVVGHHIGLVELEHEVSFLHLVRTFPLLAPLSSNQINGRWIPPIDADHIIEAVSRTQDSSTVAAYAYDNSENFHPQVFSTNVALNTFGPLITLTDESFQTGLIPKLAYNDRTNKALLGIQTIGNPFIPPTFASVDLRDGSTTIFSGVGQGDVNGLAIDPGTNIACSTTEIDFSVQFYTLGTLSGFSQPLPGATNQLFSGADVAVDTLHHLFLVAQPISSTAPGTSSIHVYDESGNLIESLDGFQFSNASNVVAMHIALHPSQRIGYVDGPDPGVTQIQAFVY
jgi:hypothetical protein